MQSIPQEDLNILEDFFRSLFIEGDFAYTLFGSKPMAISTNRLDIAFLKESPRTRRRAIALVRGWQIWTKYQFLFSPSQFYFCANKVPNESFSVALACKKRCIELINQHLSLFQKATNLGNDTDAIFNEVMQQWVSKYIHPQDFPCHYFQCLGILLGYGQANAEAFEKRSMYMDMLNLAPLDLTKQVSLKDSELINFLFINSHINRLPSKVYTIQPDELLKHLQSLEDKFSYIKASYQVHPLSIIVTPGFMAIKDHPETDQIKRQYDKLRRKLTQIYYSDHFLETILNQLTTIQLTND